MLGVMLVKEALGTPTTIKILNADVTLNDIWCPATIAADAYDSTNCKLDTDATKTSGALDYTKTTQFSTNHCTEIWNVGGDKDQRCVRIKVEGKRKFLTKDNP